MDELLLKLYEKHPFIKDNGARSSVTDKLVAEEFYNIGYNAAIDEFVDKIYDVSDFVREPSLISGGYSVATLENIEKIAEQMKTE